jgi:hypothetical protein
MLLSNILQALSGTINNIYIGQMLGVQAMAAVSGFFPVAFFCVSFIIGLGAGLGADRAGLGCARHRRVKASPARRCAWPCCWAWRWPWWGQLHPGADAGPGHAGHILDRPRPMRASCCSTCR